MTSSVQEHEGEIIDLKVLSPSTEVTSDIHFPQLPVTTTVGELKLRIRDTLPTHPDTVRQRLIYRGRVVANDGDNMVTVFGSQALQDSKCQIIHLVLRELRASSSGASTASRSPTVSPNPFRSNGGATPTFPPPPQTNPFRAPPLPNRPQSQPPPFHVATHPQTNMNHNVIIPHPPVSLAPQPFPMAHTIPHMGQVLPGVPPQFRQMVEQQQRDFQRVVQQQQQQMAQAGVQVQPNSEQGTPAPSHRTSPNPDQLAQQQSGTLTQPQLGRSGGIGVLPHRRVASAENLQRSASQPASQARVPIPTSHPHITPGTTHTVNASGPNGEQWTMTINNGTITLPNGSASMGVRLPTPIPGQPLPRPFQWPYPIPAGTPPPGTMPQGFQIAPGNMPRTDGATPIPRPSADQDVNFLSIMTRLEQTERELTNLRNMFGATNNSTPPGLGPSMTPMQRLAAMQHYERLRNHARDLANILREMCNALRLVPVDGTTSSVRATGSGSAENVDDLRGLADRLYTEARLFETRINRLVLQAANSPAFNQMPRSASPAGRVSSQVASRVASRATSPSPLARIPHPAQAYQDAQSPMVYLLSSPEGPQALLLSDQGNFATTNLSQFTGRHNLVGLTSQYPPLTQPLLGSGLGINADAGMARHGLPGNTNQTNGNARQLQNNQPQGAQILQPQRQADQQQNRPQAFALLGYLAQALPHVWLALRIGGIMWLFANGSDWVRPLLCGMAATAFYLYQMGVVGRGWGDIVRQRFERLLNEDAGMNNAQNVDGQPGQENQQLQQGEVGDPGRMAARLVAQAQAPRWAWLRSTERVVAMFFASLWPGVGEQHLAAREAVIRRQVRQQEDGAAEVGGETQPRGDAAEDDQGVRAGDAEIREDQGELRRRPAVPPQDAAVAAGDAGI